MFFVALYALVFALIALTFFVFAQFATNVCFFSFCLLGRVKVRDTAPGAGCSWAVSPPGGLFIGLVPWLCFFLFCALMCLNVFAHLGATRCVYSPQEPIALGGVTT